MRRIAQLWLVLKCYKIANFYIDKAYKYKAKAIKWRDKGNKFLGNEV